jgi:N-formylglutamate amidohydrolase
MAWESMTSSDTPPAAFTHMPAAEPGPVLLSSPHSGRFYPAELQTAARLDATQLRRSEDAFVDQLIAAGPAFGMALFTATHARAFVDVNREPSELDMALFQDPPILPYKPSARVQAGLGVLPRVVGVGLDIYHRRLRFADGARRIRQIHTPYHEALAQLLAQTQARHGHAVLLDWHSMPSAAVATTKSHNGRTAPSVVLGDLNGAACAPQVTEAVLTAFERRGYKVSVNDPYAGGYTTQRYGRPQAGIHVLQIELDRTLYMDELRILPHAGFAGLRDSLTSVLAELSTNLPALSLNRPNWPIAAE